MPHIRRNMSAHAGRLIAALADCAGEPMPTQAWARLFNVAVIALFREDPDLEGGQAVAARHVLREVLARVAGTGDDYRALRRFLPLTLEHSPMLRPALQSLADVLDHSEDPDLSGVREIVQLIRLDADRSLIGIFGRAEEETTDGPAASLSALAALFRDLSVIEKDLLSPESLEGIESGPEALALCIELVNLLEADHLLRTNRGSKPAVLRDRALQVSVFDILCSGMKNSGSHVRSDLLQALRDAGRTHAPLGAALEALAQNLRAQKPGENLKSSLGFDRIVSNPVAMLKALHLIRNGNPDHMASCPWLKLGVPEAVKTAMTIHAYRQHFVQVEGAEGARIRLEASCLKGDRQAEVIQRLYRLYIDHCARLGLAPKSYGLRMILLDGEIVLQDRSGF